MTKTLQDSFDNLGKAMNNLEIEMMKALRMKSITKRILSWICKWKRGNKNGEKK